MKTELCPSTVDIYKKKMCWFKDMNTWKENMELYTVYGNVLFIQKKNRDGSL